IRYEARSLCWIYVPETIKGICKQRLRWAQGGNEVLLKYFWKMIEWKNRRMWPLYLEYATSVIWCYLFIGTVILWILNHFINLPESLIVRNIMPGWTGIILAVTCTIQLCVGVIIDSRYDPSMRKVIPYLIWYPAIYWIITCITTVIALPRAIFKKKTELAVWESPDRGLK
ncbi:MAG TPA: hypothetical protein P5105_02515, partial [Victivallales bacterium]|nr:hypothetical protein [Victivallales bacterium]